MITQPESGLTSDEYNALLAATTDGVFQVIAHRENLKFEPWKAHSNAAGFGGNEASAVICNGYLFQIITNPSDAAQSQILRTHLTSGAQTTLSLTLSPRSSNLCKLGTSSDSSGNEYPVVYCVETDSIRYWNLNNNGDNPAEGTAVTASDFSALNNSSWIISGNMGFTGGTASASSTSGSYAAANAFDLNKNTMWSGTTTSGWIRYDFGANPKNIVAFRITASVLRRWYIDVSNDGTNWTKVYNQFETVDSAYLSPIGSIEGKLNTGTNTYRYYRLNITATHGSSLINVTEFQGYVRPTPENVVAIVPVLYAAGSRTNTVGLFALLEIPHKKVYVFTFLSNENSAGWDVRPGNINGAPLAFNYLPSTVSGYLNISGTGGFSGLIVLTTELPGRYSQKLENGVLKNKYQARQGIIAFKIVKRFCSEHIEVDTVDIYSDTENRTRATVQFINGQYYVLSKFSAGTSSSNISGYRIYTSADGMNWSLGQIINLNLAKLGDDEVYLLQSGEYVYAVNRTSIARDYSTLYMGYASSNVQFDISKYIGDYSLSHEGMLQAAFTLNNSDGTFNNHTVVNPQNIVVFEHYVGYVINNQPKKYLIGRTRLDTFEIVDMLKDQLINIRARDKLSMASDHVISEEFHQFNDAQIEYDTFTDQTGTGYGGLAHFAGTGSFKASGNQLIASAQRGTGSYTAGYSTLVEEAWNGSVSAAIRIPNQAVVIDGSGLMIRQNPLAPEYYGIKIYYQETSDVIIVQSDQNPLLGTYSNKLNWTTPSSTYNYIKVEFSYGALVVYQSTDGKVWTIVIKTLLDYSNQLYGSPYEHDISSSSTPNNIGRIGVFAYALNSANSATAYWKQLMVSKSGLPLTVENAVKYLVSKAGINNFKFYDRYSIDFKIDPAVISPTIGTSYAYNSNAYGRNLRVSIGNSSYNAVCVYHNKMRYAPNVVVSYYERIGNFDCGVVFFILSISGNSPTSGFAVRVSGFPAFYRFNSNSEFLSLRNYLLSGADSYPPSNFGIGGVFSGQYHVAFYQSERDKSNWYHLAVFQENKLVGCYVDKTANVTQNEGIWVGLGAITSYDGEDVDVYFYEPRIADLTEPAEICSLDPGETPLSALQRTIEGRNIKMGLRHNDAFRAWKPRDEAAVMTISRSIIEERQQTHNPHLIKNHIRMLGAYSQAEYLDVNLIGQYGHRFQEVNNPYLMSTYDCYQEAMAVVRRFEEASIEENIVLPFRPFIEPEDHITVIGKERIVSGYSINFTPPQIVMNLRLRKFAYNRTQTITASATATALPATAHNFNVYSAQAAAVGYGAMRSTISNLVLSTQSNYLIAYWKLDETSGTTVNDSSGNNRYGGYIGTYTLNQSGVGDGSPCVIFGDGGFQLSGSQLTSLDNAFDKTQGTIFVCAYRDTNTSASFGHFGNFSQRIAIRGEYNSSNIRGSYMLTQDAVAAGAIGDWMAIAYTWDRVSENKGKLYINGSLEAEANLTTTMTNGVYDPIISSGNARVAHLAVWNRILSASEIARLSPGWLFG